MVGVAGDCITGETVEPDAELVGLGALSPGTTAEEEDGVREEGFSVATTDSADKDRRAFIKKKDHNQPYVNTNAEFMGDKKNTVHRRC